MNWNEIGTQIILGIISILFGVLGIYATYLINKYIKDKELKDIVNSLYELVRTSVLEVYQTYVQELKDKGMFDEKAQKEALQRCLDLIRVNMPDKVKSWLETNVSDIQKYLRSLIEAQIGLLKNGGKYNG